MTNYDPNALLMATGSRSAKFEEVGATVVGLVRTVEVRQRNDIKTGEPMTWPDGNPRNQLIIGLQTEAHEDEDDDGVRSLYVPIPSQLQKALAEAIRKAGASGISQGMKVGVKFSKTEPPKTRGFSPTKIYTVKVEAPVQSVSVDDLDGQEPDDTPF